MAKTPDYFKAIRDAFSLPDTRRLDALVARDGDDGFLHINTEIDSILPVAFLSLTGYRGTPMRCELLWRLEVNVTPADDKLRMRATDALEHLVDPHDDPRTTVALAYGWQDLATKLIEQEREDFRYAGQLLLQFDPPKDADIPSPFRIIERNRTCATSF